MKEEMKMEFLRRMDQTKGEKQIPEEIEVIYGLGKSSWGREESGRMIADLLWDSSVNPKVSHEVSQVAIKRFSHLLDKWDFCNTRKYFELIIENLKSHTSPVQSLKIFEKIVSDVDYCSFAERAHPGEEDEGDMILNTSDCIEHYIASQDIVGLFFADMKHYCELVKAYDGKIKDA
jgi:hypothetical protein